jgi:hypothetical protein
LGEHDEGGTPQGVINHLRDHTGQAGDVDWDAALVQHCDYWSHFDHRSEQSAWPIIATATAHD